MYSVLSSEKSAKDNNISHYNIKQKRSPQADKMFNVFKQAGRTTALPLNSQRNAKVSKVDLILIDYIIRK